MAATEGGVTPWYLLTLAMGGQLFDDNFNPTFSDPSSAGYKALQWEADAVKNGWVSPGSVSLDDSAAFDKFTAGETAIVLATGPGNLATANDPRASRASPATPRWGSSPASTARAPRSACPRASRSRSPPSTRRPPRRSSSGGSSPRTRSRSTRRRAACPAAPRRIKQLADSGQLQGGDVPDAELPHVSPLFPQRRADLVLAVQLRRPGPAERGGQGRHERVRRAQPARLEGQVAQPVGVPRLRRSGEGGDRAARETPDPGVAPGRAGHAGRRRCWSSIR